MKKKIKSSHREFVVSRKERRREKVIGEKLSLEWDHG
jgi:hypothetical protein